MSDAKKRTTRYGAFFESADKVTKSGRKSPARVDNSEKSTTTSKSGRKSPARIDVKAERKESPSPVKKSTKRASKSPARGQSKSRKASKSPSRAVKKETKSKKEKEADEKKKIKKITPNVVIESLNLKDTKKEKNAKDSKETKKKSPSRTAKPVTKSDLDSDPDFSPLPKRRTRQQSAAEKADKGSVSVSRSVVDEFSDHEEQLSFKKRVASKLDELKEFGGTIGCILLLVLYPVVAYGLNYLCNQRSCVLKQPSLAEFKRLTTYYDIELSKIIFPFVAGVTALNIFPLGRVIKVHTDRGYTEFQYNGLTLSIATVAGIVAAEYFKYPVVDVIYRHYLKLLLFYIGTAIFQSVILFLRSRYVSPTHLNPFAKTGSFIQDLFVGREINPKIFSLLDVKLINYHISLITTLVLNGIFIFKNVNLPVIHTDLQLKAHEKTLYLLQNAKFELVPLVVSSLIILYVLDLLIFEHHLSKTFELQYEGVGAGLLLRYATFPFVFSLIAKYSLEYKIKLPVYVTIIIAVLFITGLIFKRAANKAKHDFRLNPTSSKSLGELD